MLVSLTVGKVDAGVAVLLTEDKRLASSPPFHALIEFPSILLPSSITSGSIVDITVSQNHTAEQKSQASFISLQKQILNTYGINAPATPVLRLRNATQTSLVLEWDPIQLATTTLRSLSLYRNGSKAGNIPRPLDMTSTKISGLAVDSEFSFYLVLRTSGGTYTSNVLEARTHNMNNLTGITVTPGVLPPQLRDSLEVAVKRIGARLVDTVRIDTTHFICTEGRGSDWEKANEMNIPVVRPEWIEGCEREGKIIGVRGYYLDADPRQRQVGSNPSLSNSRPSVNAPAAPIPQQANLPQRSKEPPPRSPDQESTVSGEPGPELPPTPPAKDDKDLPAAPQGQDEEDSEEEDDNEEDEEPQVDERSTVEAKEKQKAESSDEESSASPPVNATKNKEPPTAEDGKDGAEMEDVAL